MTKFNTIGGAVNSAYIGFTDVLFYSCHFDIDTEVIQRNETLHAALS